VALPAVIRKAEGWSGGSTGVNLLGLEPLSGLGIEVTFLGRTLTYNDWLYYLCWTVAALLFAAAWLLLRGRLGRAFKAIRDSEVAAASSGIGPAAYKTLAFGISAFYAGIAGSLYALAVTYVNPEVFPVTLSILLLVGVVVGGLGTLWTTVFGAAFIQFLPDVAQRISQQPGSPAIVYAVVLIGLMLAFPSGIAGLLRLTNRVYHRRP
jgi:branched-chain amino acid transport system permease protein